MTPWKRRCVECAFERPDKFGFLQVSLPFVADVLSYIDNRLREGWTGFGGEPGWELWDSLSETCLGSCAYGLGSA